MADNDAVRLETLLSSIPAEELAVLFGRRRFQALHGLVAGENSAHFSDSLIARYAVALEGSRILEDPSVLSALLFQLGPVKLRDMSRQYLEQPFARDADNALALASKPLRAGSALTSDILSALGLSDYILQEVERKRAVETVEPFEVLPPLLDYQSEIRDRCSSSIASGTRELLIQMPTGAGKTRTAMELLVDLIESSSLFRRGNSIVWLAHTEELCEQAIDAFTSVWSTRGSDQASVVRMFGSYAPPQVNLAGAIIIAGTARLHALRSKDPKAFETLAARATILVIDEAHRALAPTVRSQIAALRKPANGILIGLSATPARTTEGSSENTALAALFGRNLITPQLGEDPIGELRRRGILSTLERVELRYSSDEEEVNIGDAPTGGPDDDLPEAVLASLATHTRRNAAIVKELERRVSRERPAIVFCCSVSHAELLAAALRLKGVRAATVDCRMRRGARRWVIQEFSKGKMEVLLNFGVLSTGFDAPNVRTVVIARPTRSMILYSQMLGRGLRGPKMGGTAICTLVDVRDHLGRFGDLSALYQRFKPYWLGVSSDNLSS